MGRYFGEIIEVIKMADFNEENGIHADDITWENYKHLVATDELE